MAMKKPVWQRGLTVVDRQVAPRIEAALQHETFGLGMTLVSRARSKIESKTERLSRRFLHALNLPAASDVNRLLAQIGLLERQLRILTNKVEDGQPSVKGGGRVATRPSSAPRPRQP